MSRSRVEWDGDSEPRCEDQGGSILLDSLAGAALMAGAGVAVKEDEVAPGIVAMFAGLGFGLSALAGKQHLRECRENTEAWRAARAVRYEERRRDRAAAPPVIASVAEPTGFYCATTQSGGTCTRSAMDCERVRSLVAELGACEPAASAVCFAGRCYPTVAACEAAKGPDGVGDCVEKR